MFLHIPYRHACQMWNQCYNVLSSVFVFGLTDLSHHALCQLSNNCHSLITRCHFRTMLWFNYSSLLYIESKVMTLPVNSVMISCHYFLFSAVSGLSPLSSGRGGQFSPAAWIWLAAWAPLSPQCWPRVTVGGRYCRYLEWFVWRSPSSACCSSRMSLRRWGCPI